MPNKTKSEQLPIKVYYKLLNINYYIKYYKLESPYHEAGCNIITSIGLSSKNTLIPNAWKKTKASIPF